MGSLISAPISALGTCLGSCAGTAVTAGCCKLAGSGEVGSAGAARCVLLWLQIFTVALALVTSKTAQQWLPWGCSHLEDIGMKDTGICQCHSDSELSTCWSEQLVYRAEVSAVVVFLFLLLLFVSGCKDGAARHYSVGKFMVVMVLQVVFLFVPNLVFDAIGSFASIYGAVFLVLQAVLVIDFGYTWNDAWYKQFLEVQRRELVGRRGYSRFFHIGGLIAASITLLGGSVGLGGWLYASTPNARVITAIAGVLDLCVLIVSITDWCKHGSLLCSCVVSFYTVWLLWQSIAVMPGADSATEIPQWLGLTICMLSLLFLAKSGTIGKIASSSESTAPGSAQAALAVTDVDVDNTRDNSERAEAEQQAATSEPLSASFVVQYIVHIAAAMYIVATLAPAKNIATYVSHQIAVFMCLLLYGWSLIAPQVMKNRSFN